MGKFNSDDQFIYFCGQETLRRNGVAIIVNKRIQNAIFRVNLKNDEMISVCFQSVSSVSQSCPTLCDPWIAARQASLSITNSQSSLKLTSIESVMPSSHLILCRPLLLLPPIPPSIRVFPMSQLFAWGGQSTGVSALASFLPKNTQDQSPLEWTGWISLQSKGLSRVLSNCMLFQ